MKTLDEKLKAEAEEIARIKEKLKMKEQRHAKTKAAIVSRDRKAENHRKFENGGEIEKWLGSDCSTSRIAIVAQVTLKIEEFLGRKLEEADIKRFESFIQDQEDDGFLFSSVMNATPEENKSGFAIPSDDE